MPAYVSKLTIGPRRERPPERWDFVWQIDAPAPTAVPAELASATHGVGRDLSHSIEVTGRFPALRWAYRAGDGAVGLLDLISRMPVPAREGAHVAEAVAETVQDRLCGYDFVQWPVCPGHRHPLRPRTAGDAAWWTCPQTSQRVVPIGGLGGS